MTGQDLINYIIKNNFQDYEFLKIDMDKSELNVTEFEIQDKYKRIWI